MSQSEFDAKWDLLFGGKNMKKQNEERNRWEFEKMSQHWAPNGKRSAIVNNTDAGFEVELYNRSALIRVVECHGKSLDWAEDVAENWTLGVIKE